MSTDVIYARVPSAMKEAADAYASRRGVTLTAAVVDLLDRGLAALSDERSVAELERNLQRVTAEKQGAEAALHATGIELGALRALAQRAARAMGTCPNRSCGQPVTGIDLLATGQCHSCGQAMATLVAPSTPSSTIDERELLMLVGALGAVLGIAYLSSK
jgi:hypothetical protein